MVFVKFLGNVVLVIPFVFLQLGPFVCAGLRHHLLGGLLLSRWKLLAS
jgi:glycopeptide antibiotics resistance protein